MNSMELQGYFFAILMGLSLGVIGGDGSILTVPILVYFFKQDAVLATTDSLFIVGTTALLGAAMNVRRGFGFMISISNQPVGRKIYLHSIRTKPKPTLKQRFYSRLHLFLARLGIAKHLFDRNIPTHFLRKRNSVLICQVS